MKLLWSFVVVFLSVTLIVANDHIFPPDTCPGHLKILVPLYVYPGPTWDTVATYASLVPTVIIINPETGPGKASDPKYQSYITKVIGEGLEVVGYVHTSWGQRALTQVQQDIDHWKSFYPNIQGIFLDEGATTANEIGYYTTLYNYIKAKGWKYDIINPGTVPAAGYENVATQIVTFEDHYTKFQASANPNYASCTNKDKFAAIAYGVPESLVSNVISIAQNKNYYGWIYVTDNATNSTYNTLVSYYPTFAKYVATN